MSGRRWLWWLGLAPLAVAAALSAPAWLPALAAALSPASLAAGADRLRGLGPWAPAASLLLMAAQSVIAPLPGSLVAAANGVVFGPWWGSLLSWAGGMLGAAATYLIGRRLGESAARRWRDADLWRRLGDLSGRHGFWVVLMARLTPLISLDFIGYLAGAARMPAGAYLLASGLGSLPGMLIYTLIGHDLAAARGLSWRAGAALLALAALALAGQRFFARR